MRKKVLLVLALGVLLAAIAVSVRLFVDYGAAHKSSRLSTLLSVRACLMDYARSHGTYPEEIKDAVSSEIMLGELSAMPIEYLAAGKPYPLVGDKRLFCDQKAKRYAFEVGWFEFGEDGWVFHCRER